MNPYASGAAASHADPLTIDVLREFHRRIPDYDIRPGTELVYTAALRSVESLPLTFPVAVS